MPESDITKMKVADLKRELKMRGLATTGNKTELQDRLQTAMLDGDISLEDASIVIDELLDEDGILTDEEESKILDGDEHELLSSPTVTPTGADLLKPLHVAAASTTSASSAIVTEDDILASPTPDSSSVTGKKIVLKRKSISMTEISTDSAAKNSTDVLSPGGKEPASDVATPPKTVKMSQRNPITVEANSSSADSSKDSTGKTQLTMQERLELRAKKFGITPAAKPAATTATPTSPTPSKAASLEIIKSAPPMSDEKQVELLKKRAERFGCTVSSKIAKIDAEEKLKKRQERFGLAAAAAGGAADSGNSVPADEKLLKRQQRFGLSATAGNGTVSAEAAEKARARLERFKAMAPVTATGTAAVVASAETLAPAAAAVTATEGN